MAFDLMKKLCAELPGILNWALEGLKSWRDVGLRPPEKVVAAVAEYRADMDRLADFISSTCHVGLGLYVPTGDLYTTYKSWAYDNGEEVQSKRTFSIMLSEKGFGDDVRTVAGRKQRVKVGLALAQEARM